MKVQYRIPKENLMGETNICAEAKNLFQLWRLWRKAKKLKATGFFIFIDEVD